MAESRHRVALVALVVVLGVAYAVPFLGFPLSLLVPFVLYAMRGQLWPAVGSRQGLVAVGLAWLGLWLPALADILTGWSNRSGLTDTGLSTSWLLLPLCGPSQFLLGTLVPAVAATLVSAAGLALSARIGRPWPLVVAAWLAPWVHLAVFAALPVSIAC